MCRLCVVLKDRKLRYTAGLRLRMAAPVQQHLGPHAVSIMLINGMRGEYQHLPILNVLAPSEGRRQLEQLLSENDIAVQTDEDGQQVIKIFDSVDNGYSNYSFVLSSPINRGSSEQLDDIVQQINSGSTDDNSWHFTGYGSNLIVAKDTVRADRFFEAHNFHQWDAVLAAYQLRYATAENLKDPEHGHGFTANFFYKDKLFTLLGMANGQLTNPEGIMEFVDNYRPMACPGSRLIARPSTKVDTDYQTMVCAIKIYEKTNEYEDIRKGIQKGLEAAMNYFDGPFTYIGMMKYGHKIYLAIMTDTLNRRPIYIGHPLGGGDSIAASSSEDSILRAFPEGALIDTLREQNVEIFEIDSWETPDPNPEIRHWIKQGSIFVPREFQIGKQSAAIINRDALDVDASLLKSINIEFDEDVNPIGIRDYNRRLKFKALDEKCLPPLYQRVKDYFDRVKREVNELFGVTPTNENIILASETGKCADVSPLGSEVINLLIDQLGSDSNLRRLEIKNCDATWDIGVSKGSGNIYGKRYDFTDKTVVLYGSAGNNLGSLSDDITFIVKQKEVPEDIKAEFGRMRGVRRFKDHYQGNLGEKCGESLGKNGMIICEGDAAQETGRFARGRIYINGKSGARTGAGLFGGTIVVRETVGVDSFESMNSGVGVIGWRDYTNHISNDIAQRLGNGMVGGIIYFGGGLEHLGELGENTSVVRLNELDKRLLEHILKEEWLDASRYGAIDRFVKIIPKYYNVLADSNLLCVENFGDEVTEEYIPVIGEGHPLHSRIGAFDRTKSIYLDEQEAVRRQRAYDVIEDYLSSNVEGDRRLSDVEREILLQRYKKNMKGEDIAVILNQDTKSAYAANDVHSIKRQVRSRIKESMADIREVKDKEVSAMLRQYFKDKDKIIYTRDFDDSPICANRKRNP